MAKNAGEYLRA